VASSPSTLLPPTMLLLLLLPPTLALVLPPSSEARACLCNSTHPGLPTLRYLKRVEPVTGRVLTLNLLPQDRTELKHGSYGSYGGYGGHGHSVYYAPTSGGNSALSTLATTLATAALSFLVGAIGLQILQGLGRGLPGAQEEAEEEWRRILAATQATQVESPLGSLATKEGGEDDEKEMARVVEDTAREDNMMGRVVEVVVGILERLLSCTCSSNLPG